MALSHPPPRGRWAGGDFKVEVSFCSTALEVSCAVETSREWSSNGKWSGLSAKAKLKLKKSWLKEVYAKNLACLDDMLTLDARYVSYDESIDADIYEAIWAQQSRGLSVQVVAGYILTTKLGSIHAKMISAAKRVYAKRVKHFELEQKKLETEKIKKENLLKSFITNIEAKETLYSDITVTVQDSLRAGNCEAGTSNFVEKYFSGQVQTKAKKLFEIIKKIASDDFRRAKRIFAAIESAIKRSEILI